ncbi:penicillin-binding protein activator [Deltaproteobacteria bacterium]|nr:penicillin-binding protein activator [Deltaproteobacteria bacterium]
MRYEFRLIQKAVSTLAVGMAFFLFACQAKMMVERGPAEKLPVSGLYDIAKKDFHAGRYKEALEGFKNILAEYPGYPEAPSVKHDMAEVYYRMGDFKNSAAESLEWFEKYPSNQLRGEVLLLLGNSYNALGDRPEAFRWWIALADAVSSEYESEIQQEDIDARIIELINWSRANELKDMAEYGSDSPYIPNIYYRLSVISLDESMIEEAKDFAMLLVRSTQEQHWITTGRELLDEINRITEAKDDGGRVIGCLLPLSGPYALYGQEILNGIKLGMDLFNQLESGPDLELVIRDTKGSIEDAVAGVEELVQREEVMAILGPLASGPSTAAVKKAEELGVPIISFTQKEGITNEGDMVFRNFLIPSKEVEALLDKAVNEIGMKRFGIFYPDNAYGHFFMNLFWDKVEEMGATVTAVESYNADDTDFEVGIKKMVGLYYPRPESVVLMLEILKTLRALEEMGYGYYWEHMPWDIVDLKEDKEEVFNVFVQEDGVVESVFRGEEAENITDQEEDEGPEPIVDFDAVFIPGSHQQVALIAPQFPFYNVFNVPFLGTSLWLSDDLLDTAGSYIQGAIFPAGFFLGNDSEIVKNFVESYNENFELDPGILAANGYDTIRLIKDILGNSRISTRIDFQKALFEHDIFYGVTGEISFDVKGEVEKPPILLTVYGRSLYLLR